MTQELFEQVRKNAEALDKCKGHRFGWPSEAEYVNGEGQTRLQMGAKMTCGHCGGTMSAVSAFIYAKGYAAAGGDICDVIPGLAVDSGNDGG